MSTDVIMPQMGESIAEGTIVRWIKKVGDKVTRDEPLFEISTDKVDAEIPSPASGVLTEIRVNEGETVEVNAVVAIIGDGDGAAATPPAETAAPQAAPPAAEPPAPAPAPAPQPEPAPQPQAAPQAPQQPQQAAPSAPAKADADAPVDEVRRARSSPLVRKLASEHGVDISQLQGTGVGGRVTKEDLLAHVEHRGKQPAAAGAGSMPAPPVGPTTPTAPAELARTATAPQAASTAPAPAPAQERPVYKDGDRIRIEPLSVMRKKIAEHMVESRRTSAHVNTIFEMDMTRMVQLRAELKGRFEADGVKLTYTPMILKALIESLKAFPIMNASIQGDNVVYKQDINLGIAVALDWGLIVPVVKNADEKSLLGLARAVNDLSERARSKKLRPDEVQEGTFTVTNPGIYGGMFGTPIINQPQVAILGVGAIEKRPVVVNDAIAIRTMCYMSLSFDHRLIDGAVADQFMAHLKQTLATGQFSL